MNKQLEDVPKPQHFLPTIKLPAKVFTFITKPGINFSERNTHLTTHILEVAQAVRDAEKDQEPEESSASASNEPHDSREATVSLHTASQGTAQPIASPIPDPSHHSTSKEATQSQQSAAPQA